jgi:hypothetical protein
VNRLRLQLVGASVAAASVVLGAVICAQFGQAALAAALAVYALGAGAWLYHAVERYVVARRLSTVRSAAKPLLPVMAAIIGLTQAVVRALSDVAELQPQRRELPVWRLVQITRGSGRTKTRDE